jgi:hypothetical protein
MDDYAVTITCKGDRKAVDLDALLDALPTDAVIGMTADDRKISVTLSVLAKDVYASTALGHKVLLRAMRATGIEGFTDTEVHAIDWDSHERLLDRIRAALAASDDRGVRPVVGTQARSSTHRVIAISTATHLVGLSEPRFRCSDPHSNREGVMRIGYAVTGIALLATSSCRLSSAPEGNAPAAPAAAQVGTPIAPTATVYVTPSAAQTLPTLVQVPDLAHRRVDVATFLLSGQGLGHSLVGGADAYSVADWEVCASIPRAGTTVPSGTRVALVITPIACTNHE